MFTVEAKNPSCFKIYLLMGKGKCKICNKAIGIWLRSFDSLTHFDLFLSYAKKIKFELFEIMRLII